MIFLDNLNNKYYLIGVIINKEIMRNTIQKEATLQAVRNLGCHPTADEVYSEVVSKYPHISKGTVYRNLGILAESGLIRKIPIPGSGADRYDHNLMVHSHAVCRKCGKIVDITQMEKRFPEDKESGFKIEECEYIYTGLCKTCQELN